jgi:hypothetical protein
MERRDRQTGNRSRVLWRRNTVSIGDAASPCRYDPAPLDVCALAAGGHERERVKFKSWEVRTARHRKIDR